MALSILDIIIVPVFITSVTLVGQLTRCSWGTRANKAFTVLGAAFRRPAIFISFTLVRGCGSLISPIERLHDNFNDQMPEFYSPLENITTTQGRDVQFTCVVNHLGEYRVAWIKSDSKAILAIHNRLVAHNPRLAVTHNGHNTWKLHVLNIQKNDTGSYMCQINTDPMRWQLGYLNVTVPPDILNDDDIYSDGYQALEGGTIHLRCRATGEPQPEVSWKREDGKPIIFRRDNRTLERETVYGGNLTLLDVRRSDMGNYLCLARSPVPPIMSKRFSVKINFQPQIVNISNHYVGASYVKNVTFRCLVEASPKATHRWIRGRGEPIITNQRIHISEHSITNEYTTEMRLHLTYPGKQDYGDYVCISENTIGRAEGKIKFSELNFEETTTRIPFRVDYLPRGDNQLTKKIKYDDSSMKFVTKQPFHHYDKTTKFHPIKIERERTRQIESNDVIPDASTTQFTSVYKNSDRDSHSTVHKAKERYEREKKFRNQGDHLRLCPVCEFVFILHVIWVTLVL